MKPTASPQVKAAQGVKSPAATSKVPPGRLLGKSAGAAITSRSGQGAGRSATTVNPSVAPPLPPVKRGRITPLTPKRQAVAKSMRKLAGQVQESHPDMTVHQHLRDAAATLESGQDESAERHLRAALFALTPQSLMRNGMHTDDLHTAARKMMHGVHRQLLLTKDIVDIKARNQEAINRASYGDASSAPAPVQPNPNAGYGPGALAQRPTARQPAGDQALNAPSRGNSGGSDPNVADPAGSQPKGSKQFTSWGELVSAIELAFRYNPAEKRNKHGEWSNGVAGLLSKAAAAREGGDPFQSGRHSRAAEALAGAHAKTDKTAARAYSELRLARVAREAGDEMAAQMHERNAAAITGSKGSTVKPSRFVNMTPREVAALPAKEQAAYNQWRAQFSGQDPAVELAFRFNPAQPRDSHGRWTGTGAAKTSSFLRAPGRMDPKSVIAVGGGRKNWMHEASQMPDAKVRQKYPAIAARMRQITPERLQQARSDSLRIGNGLAPLHPELAQIWPGVYGNAKGVTTPLPLPKAVRTRHDPVSVTGLTDARADYLKAAYLQSTGNLSGGNHPAINLGSPTAIRNEVCTVMDLAGYYTWDDLASVVVDLCTPVELARPWLPSKEYWASVGAGHGSAPKDRGGSDEEKADNHISDAKKAASMGMHDQAASHLARASALTSDPAKQSKINAVGKGAAGMAVAAGKGSAYKLSNTRQQAVELSAETGRLAVTPAPRGKPGGPGLYNVKGNMHSPYLQNVVKALIRQGKTPGEAYAIAWSSLRKWSAKSKHPEVRAAAAGGLAEEGVAEARAHAHANGPGRAIELVGKKGYVHGFIYVGGAGLPSVAQHNLDRPKAGKVQAGDRVAASFHPGQKLASHQVMSVSHTGSGKTARTHMVLRNTKTGETHRQSVSSHTKLIARVAKAPHAPTAPLNARQRIAIKQLVAGGMSATTATAKARRSSYLTQAVTWKDIAGAVELAVAGGTPAQTAQAGQAQSAAQPRVPAGSAAGGQFGSSGPPSKGSAKASATAKTTAAKKTQSKASLLAAAANDRKQADALIAQRDALAKALASASGKVSSGQSGSTTSGQSGSTTSAGASTTSSSAPATSSTASSSTAPSSSTPSSTSSSSTSGASATQIRAQIAQLNTQIVAYQQAYKKAMTQAAAMK